MKYNIIDWESQLSALSKLIFVIFKSPNFTKISDMDWVQHIKIDYAQILKKDSVKVKNDPHKIYIGCCQPISQFYNTRNLQQFHLIWSKLQFLRMFSHFEELDIIKLTWIFVRIAPNIPILSYTFLCTVFWGGYYHITILLHKPY